MVTNAYKDTSPHTLWETLKWFSDVKPSNFVLGEKRLKSQQYLLESKLNTMESLLNTCPDGEKENLLSRINTI